MSLKHQKAKQQQKTNNQPKKKKTQNKNTQEAEKDEGEDATEFHARANVCLFCAKMYSVIAAGK